MTRNLLITCGVIVALTVNVTATPVRFYHDSEIQYTKSDIQKFVKEHGTNILIGADSGHGKDFNDAMDAADEFGVHKHVYTIGPGMWEWSAEERSQIKEHASKIGIDITKKNWMIEWKKWGWKKTINYNLIKYNSQGFYSIELDNLDSVLNEENVIDYIEFFNEYIKFRQDNGLKIKIMLKNIPTDVLKKMIEIKFDMENFAEFAIFEKGTGNPKEQIILSRILGIKAVTPINGLRPTTNYGTTRKGVPFDD